MIPRSIRNRTATAVMSTVLASTPALMPSSTTASPLPDVLERPSLMTPQAANAMLLAVARAGNRLVAVGERGVVVLSDDNGESWNQAQTPVSVSLTTVCFQTPMQGWAAGHGGVILHTADGGLTWKRQLDGKSAAKLVLSSLPTRDPSNPDIERLYAQAQQLIEDGPDKPFLDLYFESAKRGWAVGAYGLAFITEDGGEHWLPATLGMDNPKSLHLYAVAHGEGALYIAGEQGLLLISLDGGLSFKQLPSPYEGSFFAMEASGQNVAVAGMLGSAFESSDRGQTWRRIKVDTGAAFMSLYRLKDGRVVLADQLGGVFVHDVHADNAVRLPLKQTRPLADAVFAKNLSFIVAGPDGVARIDSGLLSSLGGAAE